MATKTTEKEKNRFEIFVIIEAGECEIPGESYLCSDTILKLGLHHQCNLHRNISHNVNQFEKMKKNTSH